MTQENRIPVSRAVRWRRIRNQGVPVLSFLVATIASAWLWQSHGGMAQGVGEVDSPRVDVTSPTAGLVLSLPRQARGQWLIYDRVQAGDVIARIEDQQLETSRNRLQQEVMTLIDEVTMEGEAVEEGGDVVASEAVRAAWQYEKSRLLALDDQLSPALQITSDEIRDMESPPPELPASISATSRDALARTRETRRGLELRSHEILRSTKALELQSPISGTLVAVHCWPGQTVPIGGRIATIAADYGRHIVSYIPEGSPIVARPGMQVTLRTRAAGTRQLTSEVEQVGRQVERIPSHQVAASKTPMWGTPVRIKMPVDDLLQPGTLVDVVFTSSPAR